MPDYSLVPVDHQPDFGDVSLVPVDYDPFSADDMIQQARTRLASQPQRLATSDAPIPGDVNAAMPEAYQDPNVASASGVPAFGQPYNPSAAPISAPGKPVLENQQQPGDMSGPGPASGGENSSFGKRLLQGTINAVPGAYYSGLAQQQFRQGNYGAATVYGAAALGDAALGITTLGTSTRLEQRYAQERLIYCAERLALSVTLGQ